MAVVQPRRADGLPGRNADAISRPRLALANVGVWLSLVEHLVRDEGVAGSNPATPTIHSRWFPISASLPRKHIRRENDKPTYRERGVNGDGSAADWFPEDARGEESCAEERRQHEQHGGDDAERGGALLQAARRAA